MNSRCKTATFGVPARWSLGEGPKGQKPFNLNYKVNFKDFKPNIVCFLKNERYKTYQMGFSFSRLGYAPREAWEPHPLGPWGGAKRSNIIRSQFQSQFQRFYNQTLCVFSHMKDIKPIRRDLHKVPWVMPKGLGSKKKIFSDNGHVAYQIKGNEQ